MNNPRVFKQLNSWITEKLQTASDDSYKEPRNLESKLKKHSAFCAEITVHQATIVDVKSIGQALISNEHYACDDIAQRLDNLEDRWQELLQSSSIKSRRLEGARDHVKFKQKADNLEMLIKDKVCMQIKTTTVLKKAQLDNYFIKFSGQKN